MTVTCPVCAKRFRNEQGLGGHLRHSKDSDHLARRAGVPATPCQTPQTRAPPAHHAPVNAVGAGPLFSTGGKPLPSISPSPTPQGVVTPTPNYPPALLQYSDAGRLRAQAEALTPRWPNAPMPAPTPQRPAVAQPTVPAARVGALAGNGTDANALEPVLRWIGNAIAKVLRALFTEPRRPAPPRREPTYWEQVLGTGPAGRDDD